VFTKLGKSGESGELLLYFLLETALGIPQVLCKMPLKTNTQMHVHGTDGVHVKALPNGNLALYWGESKLYADVNSAIASCFESVAPFLTDDQVTIVERDLLLIRDNLDAGAEEVTQALIKYFMEETEESAKVEVRAACLVGFSYDNYPNPHDDQGEIAHEVEEAMQKWHDRVLKAVNHHKLESFEIELFCVPLPCVDKFRSAIRDRLGLS
jgi:hypothetical protein